MEPALLGRPQNHPIPSPEECPQQMRLKEFRPHLSGNPGVRLGLNTHGQTNRVFKDLCVDAFPKIERRTI